MSSVIFSIGGIYLFIALGFLAKYSFKDQIDEKTVTLINVYFLQVFLTFWGLLVKPIDISLLHTPGIYLAIVLFVWIFSALVAKKVFFEQKEYSIAAAAALIGNTGNLGIPLCIAIFGEESIPYTTVINLANVFIVYTIGVFHYARGSYDTKTSLVKIIKLPILWAAAAAITISVLDFTPSKEILTTLQMGAYASMTMQLFLFGIYMHGARIKAISTKLLLWITGLKFVIIPLITLLVLLPVSIAPMIKGILFLQLLMPLAVANVNLASLYDCRPKTVAVLTFLTSFLFLVVVFGGVWLINALGWR